MANADSMFNDFAQANHECNGPLLAATIEPDAPGHDPARLYNFRASINQYSVRADLQYRLQYSPNLQLDKKEASAWLEVLIVYYNFVDCLLNAEGLQNVDRSSEADWGKVYDEWKEVVNALYRGYQSNTFAAWTIPCLYAAGRYLRIFAIKADERSASQRDSGLAFGGIQEEDAFDPSNRDEKLEDAARQINRLFGLCIGDRNPISDSRKWALYYIATLLFKTHFKLNHISLSRNILRSLRASNEDMPPLSVFPKSHQVSFLYYCGVIHFLEEDYITAEENLLSAYQMCHVAASKNIQLILTYLIPTKLLTSHMLPSHALLAQYPPLARLFQPVCDAIRAANLSAFNAAMERGEEEFVKRRIYLTLERGRDIILRNIFRRVFLAGGFEPAKEGEGAAPARRTRVPIDEFAAALHLAGAEVANGDGTIDRDEVECLIANAIYKNLMKGYIARERGFVVLSKAGAFPGTGA